jgi:hypothetical protein
VFEFLAQNKEWVFSGVGVTVAVALVTLVWTWGTRLAARTIQVRAVGVIVSGPMGMTDAIGIEVLNAGKQTAFLRNVCLELNDGGSLVPLRDEVTGATQQERQLNPGQSFTFHITAAMIRRSGKPIGDFRRAAVKDSAGRVYRSSGHQLRAMLTAVLAPRE